MTSGMSDDEMIILVDPQDRQTGVAPKAVAHQLGLRHRAFSILLIDDLGRLLLQRRALQKYHSGGLWANSCCGHPRPGESIYDAAVRRAREELGSTVTIREVGVFTYRTAVGDNMIEHEYDHVFVGTLQGELQPDPREIAETRWMPRNELESDMRRNPDRYVPWLAGVLRVHVPEGD